MRRLRDLTVRDALSLVDASARHDWSIPASYNIARDCLTGQPDRVAFIFAEPSDDRVVTRGELDEASSALAAGLRSMGIAPGDRVALRLSQQLEMAVAVLAVLRMGAVVVPVSKLFGDEGVRYRLDQSGARVLVSDTAVPGEDVLSTEQLWQLVADNRDSPPVWVDTAADDPALLLFTSGTTGKPKGALHAHRYLLGHSGVDYFFDLLREDDVYYSPADWAWTGGLVLGILVPLAHAVPVLAFRAGKFDAGETLNLLERHGVSVGLFPATLLRLLRDSGSVTPERRARLRLRALTSGGELATPEIVEWAEEHLGATVNISFGQTEANALIGQCAALGVRDLEALGQPMPGHRIAVLDDDLKPVPEGQVGQIAVAADDPVCMLEYWHNPEATAEKIRGGWLLTGDTGRVNADGFIVFDGRADDIINTSGYRVGPAEIEGAIIRHPDVAECAVVGLPDETRGEVVAAFIRLMPGGAADPARLTEEVQQLVRAGVGAHAYPRTVRFVEEFPRTETGKIRRAALKAAPTPG